MLKVTSFVMKLAPLAIFAALASTIATQGLSMLATYGKFVLGFYATMGVLWAAAVHRRLPWCWASG